MRKGERKPAFVVSAVALFASFLLGAGGEAADSGSPVFLSGTDDSPIVGIEQAGRVVCSGVLVDARVVVTAASCAPSDVPVCIEVAGSCVAPSATSFDPAKRIAALTLPSDADPTPIPYGRTDAPPTVGDTVQSLGYGDSTVPLLTIVSTDGQTYGIAPGSTTFAATDVGSAATFTPATSANGSPVESVYGILITLPTATSNATYARLDVLARDYLDPIVQATRDVELPGGCSVLGRTRRRRR